MNRWISILALAVAAATLCRADTNTPASGTEATTPAATTREPTEVTSERLQVDYANNTGTFEGNVLVVDPKITVRADKMVVFFGTGTNQTRSLQRIVAEGAVIITQDDRKSSSDHAVYTADDGKVVLTGNPQVQTPDGTVTGKRITFWRGLQKMDVEAGTRLVIWPEEKNKEPAEPLEESN